MDPVDAQPVMLGEQLARVDDGNGGQQLRCCAGGSSRPVSRAR